MNENKFCRHETCKTYWVKYLVLFYLIYVSYHLQPPNSLSFIIALSVCVVSKISIYFYIYDLTIQSTLVAQPAGDFTTFPASTCSTGAQADWGQNWPDWTNWINLDLRTQDWLEWMVLTQLLCRCHNQSAKAVKISDPVEKTRLASWLMSVFVLVNVSSPLGR